MQLKEATAALLLSSCLLALHVHLQKHALDARCRQSPPETAEQHVSDTRDKLETFVLQLLSVAFYAVTLMVTAFILMGNMMRAVVSSVGARARGPDDADDSEDIGERLSLYRWISACIMRMFFCLAPLQTMTVKLFFLAVVQLLALGLWATALSTSRRPLQLPTLPKVRWVHSPLPLCAADAVRLSSVVVVNESLAATTEQPLAPAVAQSPAVDAAQPLASDVASGVESGVGESHACEFCDVCSNNSCHHCHIG